MKTKYLLRDWELDVKRHSTSTLVQISRGDMRHVFAGSDHENMSRFAFALQLAINFTNSEQVLSHILCLSFGSRYFALLMWFRRYEKLREPNTPLLISWTHTEIKSGKSVISL